MSGLDEIKQELKKTYESITVCHFIVIGMTVVVVLLLIKHYYPVFFDTWNPLKVPTGVKTLPETLAKVPGDLLALPGMAMRYVTPEQSQTSLFAGKKIPDYHLSKFINYRADQDANDFNTYYPSQDDLTYDPVTDGVDQSVVDSHKQFVDESYTGSQGANSSNVERDDTNEVVRSWGLKRVDYTGAFSGDDSRTVSSETPEQMYREKASIVL